jgi:hypothetical protein
MSLTIALSCTPDDLEHAHRGQCDTARQKRDPSDSRQVKEACKAKDANEDRGIPRGDADDGPRGDAHNAGR